MKSFFKSKILVVLLLTIMPIGLVGCFKKNTIVNKSIDSIPAVNNNTNIAINHVELETQYQTKLHDILKLDPDHNNVSDIKQKILDLTVPTKFLDLHLKLVLALDSLEQGQAAANQNKVAKALAELEKLKTQYPWLN
ncbi:MAG: hypothetical protein PHW95_00515 [Patescibacteria group bacterium]|nr:hypothetical protein [Patescibacteria group bacterium]